MRTHEETTFEEMPEMLINKGMEGNWNIEIEELFRVVSEKKRCSRCCEKTVFGGLFSQGVSVNSLFSNECE
jgi:hypothetical protein